MAESTAATGETCLRAGARRVAGLVVLLSLGLFSWFFFWVSGLL